MGPGKEGGLPGTGPAWRNASREAERRGNCVWRTALKEGAMCTEGPGKRWASHSGFLV